MIKPIKIVKIEPYNIHIKFSNDEIKVLNVYDVIDKKIKNVDIEKLFDTTFFNTVKIGELGQLYWKDIAKMKTENGFVLCEYDMSPEFVYLNSENK